MSLLKELESFMLCGCYKYFAPLELAFRIPLCNSESLYSILTNLQNFKSAPASPLKMPLTVMYWPPLICEN